MKRVLGFALLIVTCGCGGHYVSTVYGGSGKLYQAPALCAAVIACKKSETTCYYETVHYSSGEEYSGCKEVDVKK